MDNEKFDFENVVIDKEHNCIDRNTELGRAFDEMRAEAESQDDPGKKEFMAQMLAYAEASLVINNTNPSDVAGRKIRKLVARMTNDAYVPRN